MDLDLDGPALNCVKHKYRHFSIPTPPESASENVVVEQNPSTDKDFRRYSDTKLLDERVSNETSNPMPQQQQEYSATSMINDKHCKPNTFVESGDAASLNPQNSPSVHSCFKSLPNLNGGSQESQ